MNDQIPRIDPEFKALIPPLSPDEYNQLEQNILADRKCRDALVVWGDIIVDGHNRFKICAQHGISFEIKEMEFDSREEAKLWILDNQLGRRNLTDAMRIELALSKMELLRQQAKENQRNAGGDKSVKSGAGALFSPVPELFVEPINIHKEVANEADVSDGTVHHYMQIAKQGSPELLESVKNGDIKIKTAYRLLETQIMKKLKLADRQYKVIEKNYPIQGNDEANRQIKAQLISLQRHLDNLLEVQNA